MGQSNPSGGDDLDAVMVDVDCRSNNEDLTAIAGGALLAGSHNGDVAIVETRPIGVAGTVPSGWQASAREVTTTSANWTLTVYAVCASVN
jgi:hypothetical protein